MLSTGSSRRMAYRYLLFYCTCIGRCGTFSPLMQSKRSRSNIPKGFLVGRPSPPQQQQPLPLYSNAPSPNGSPGADDSATLRPAQKRISGYPSAPGWKRGQLETLVTWAVNDKANRNIIREYEPDALWLWSQWRGTVLSLAFVPVLCNIVVGTVLDTSVHYFSDSSWSVLSIPPADDPIIQQLQGLNAVWDYQVTLTSLILTFFTAEAYKHWRAVYVSTRAIQGRINDICMLVTMGAQPDNEDSQELVQLCTRLIRKSHSFFWASTPTVSDGLGKDIDYARMDIEEEEIGPMLLTPEGLRGLTLAGELTTQEYNALLESGLPPTQYTYVLLEWVGLYIMEGLGLGILGNSGKLNNGLEENLLRQLTLLRGEYFNLGDLSSGRMPLAYVHLVQLLVDTLVILAPFSLYSDTGSLSVPLAALLTLFYKGLLDLSKSFLDPFGVEGYEGQNIRVDVLVSELNFGAASRWVVAAKSCPKAPYSTTRNGASSSTQ